MEFGIGFGLLVLFGFIAYELRIKIDGAIHAYDQEIIWLRERVTKLEDIVSEGVSKFGD